jgi:glycosyltransferase involved in cell wall biosynthesis
VVPHIFMHRDILPGVIFSPGMVALSLVNGLADQGIEVTLFSPGPIDTEVHNITIDLSYFEAELALRGDSYTDLLKKHPLTFISLARQAQAELISRAYQMANNDELDVVHVYTNEEDLGLTFAALCKKPVVFTHHDPYNFLVRYKTIFPKYKDNNFISMSYAQRSGMPTDTNWVANIYHGIDPLRFRPNYEPRGDYVAYLGRIIEPKGVHLAIQALKAYNQVTNSKLKLKLAGKHYAGHQKDTYWQTKILPYIDDVEIEYIGFVDGDVAKQAFLGNAEALLVPSLFDEPFGMVVIEAMACGTPVIGLESGALPELIDDGVTGLLVVSNDSEAVTVKSLAKAMSRVDSLDRKACRLVVEDKFTVERMCHEHAEVYQKLQDN